MIQLDRERQPPEGLSEQIVGLVQKLRAEDLLKLPGFAETLESAAAAG